ncbi:MAG: hypothetical protein P8076_15175 [Gammaproteobacteria bacterium]
MRIRISKSLWLPIALAVCGCSAGDDQASQPPPVDQTVFKDQMHALDKAKGVEQTLQDSAQRQRRQIDEQAR